MTEEIDQLLKNLRLNRIREILDRERLRAEKSKISHDDFLVRLLREEYARQLENRLKYRIALARIPEPWPLETFPFDRQPGVNATQVKQLAHLDFIARHQNIVLIGPTGVGKSGIATGILLKALYNGHRGAFVKAQDLFDELYASVADRSSRKLLDQLARVDLLVIDEMGYLNLQPEQTNLFFKLMEMRYGKRSTIITTNLDYDAWYEFLGRKEMVGALLSRLKQYCVTLRIEGPSLRAPDETS